MSPEKEVAIRADLQMALDTAYALLESGETALRAVEAAIVMLEDSPHFNAGKGAVMNIEGRHELDASVMWGQDLSAGAVAAMSRTRNPILAAMAVRAHSPHVLLAGEGAESFAREQGLAEVDNSYFTVPMVKQRWEAGKRTGEYNPASPADSKFGTVGAVALDLSGNLAAGTSTGGMMFKKYGRIGDSPIIGAGTYADNATCAVSCTGHGEYFIRLGIAKDVSDQMRYAEIGLEQAAKHSIHDRLSSLGGSGGLIAMDREGKIAMEFNTKGMYRAYKNESSEEVLIYEAP